MLARRVALVVLLLAAVARADDLSQVLAARAGQTIDLRAEPSLRARLVSAGLVPGDAPSVKVTADVLARSFAHARFANQVDGTRYHVGERILVRDAGSGGTFSPRAEIAAVLPDGKYRVKLWDKAEAVGSPWLDRKHVDALTGELPNGPLLEATVRENGTTRTVTSPTPWLLRANEREVTLTHEQIDELNGRTDARGPYSVNGWRIDPSTDAVLGDRIERARAIASRTFPAGTLSLPEDAAGRAARLDEISRLQESFLQEIFKDDYIEHPGMSPTDKMSEYLRDHPEMNGKVGAVLASQYGVCFDQAASMVAILNAVGPELGLTARAISGATIRESAPHGFVMIRFANGKLGMYDVAWHITGDKFAVDNMDFATWAGIADSNRRIDRIHQPTTVKTSFVDRASEKARELYRGYSKVLGETLLALRGLERGSVSDAVAANTGNERIAGDFDVAAVTARARALGAGAPSRTRGLIDRLVPDALRSRVRDAVDVDPVDRAR